MRTLGSICVVGSANLDLVVAVDHIPAVGETVLGGDLVQIAGGKGLNQAAAAANALGPASEGIVSLVGRVGEDATGRSLRRHLVAAGVDVGDLLITAAVPSGTAMISVQDDGDNAIVVSPGANAHLTAADVEASDSVRTAAVVLAQGEVPADAVVAAARQCTGVFVWNAAPAPKWSPLVLPDVDVLVVNQTELMFLLDSPDHPAEKEVVVWAGQLGIGAVVVTLGAAGALLIDGDYVELVPAETVEVVDTTGAGDAFCGALAARLALSGDLAPRGDDVAFAISVATGEVTKRRVPISLES